MVGSRTRQLSSRARTRVGDRDRPTQIGQHAQPRRHRPPGLQQVGKIGLEIRCKARPEFVRVYTQQGAVDHLREGAAMHHRSPAISRLARTSAASLVNRCASAVECAAAGRLKSEHATTVVAGRGELTNEPRVFHALERTVDRARPHAHVRAGRRFHRLHDRVAVQRTIGKRKEDVEYGGGQRRLTQGRNRLRHGSILLPLRI